MTNEPESKNSMTPLHIAAVNNRTEIATILLIQVSILLKMESLQLTHFVRTLKTLLHFRAGRIQKNGTKMGAHLCIWPA